MIRTRAIALVGLAFPTLLAAAALTTTPARGSEGQSVIDPAATPSTVHGSNFLLRAASDNNFCLQVASGTLAGRAITVQQCNPNVGEQRWAFTWNEDGTNSIVDIQGMCLDGRLRTSNGSPAAVRNCRFGDAWQFVFAGGGQIQDVKSGRCLDVPGIAANAAALLVACDENRSTQTWTVTR